jgi:23S rRNA (cytidine1920-2'-O)/16S rRNA (cytidine1409-2'-O)-methyltransferase
VRNRRRAPFVALAVLLARRRPDVDPSAIEAGRVLVDGRTLTNPSSQVRTDASLRVLSERRLRGELKLGHALDALPIDVRGRVAVDIGANVGGFTTALLERGARRVYAVDAGVGLLQGTLGADPRVVNLEGCNVGVLDRELIPDRVDVITMDLSYLAVADAVPQLECLDIDPGADLVALIKPTFELHRSTLAATEAEVDRAVDLASVAVERSGWRVIAVCDTGRIGRRGAREAFVHARRRDSTVPCTESDASPPPSSETSNSKPSTHR